MISRAWKFFREDLWKIRISETSRIKAFSIRFLRILLLAFKGISEGRTYLRASSLTFYSLLSVVPLLALLFGVAQGFGLSRYLEKQLLEHLHGQEEVIRMIIEFSHNLLETTRGGVLAGVGIVVLLWAIIRLFGNIESSFNEIWNVQTGRSFLRKLTDYPALFFLCPVLLLLSSALTVIVVAEVTFVVERFRLLEFFGPAIFLALELLPMVVLWLLFTLLYAVMPNTHVKLTSATLAGVIAGTLYLVFQHIYITFQVGVSQYNAVYGSFAALPLFLVWLQTSWMIVMVGAEIAFAHQNVDLLEYEMDVAQMSPYARKVLALSVMLFLVKRFAQGDSPVGERAVSQSLELPVVYVQTALSDLMSAGIVSEARTGLGSEAVYQPTVDSTRITVDYVLRSLEHCGQEELMLSRKGEVEKISRSLETLEERLKGRSENMLLKDL